MDVINWINLMNCSDSRLKETFPFKTTREDGVTWLEVTIYNDCRGFDPLHKFIHKEFKYNIILVYSKVHLFYTVALNTVFIKLLYTTQRNLIKLIHYLCTQ